jgi:hypothetical protein
MPESAKVVKKAAQFGGQNGGTNLRDLEKHLRREFSTPLCWVDHMVFKRARDLLKNVFLVQI